VEAVERGRGTAAPQPWHAECSDLLCKLDRTDNNGLSHTGKETLTQSTYYLKEVREAPGYRRDETVYPVGLEYFTLYDSDGKVTQQGKRMEVVEIPETVGVMVKKKDSESGNFVKGAGFAVFTDAGCTQRVSVGGDGKTEVPVFYYDFRFQCREHTNPLLCGSEKGG